MKSKLNYQRYVIEQGESIEIEHTEEIISEEPHPNEPSVLIVWTRQQDYGSLGFNAEPEVVGDDDE